MARADERIADLIEAMQRGRLSRREFGRRAAALGLGVPAARALGRSRARRRWRARHPVGGRGAAGAGGYRRHRRRRQHRRRPRHQRPLRHRRRRQQLHLLVDLQPPRHLRRRRHPDPRPGRLLGLQRGRHRAHLPAQPQREMARRPARHQRRRPLDLRQDQGPDTKTDRASRLQVGGEWATWTAPDPQTVVLTVKEPYAPFLFALSGIGIAPKHLLENSADLATDPFNLAPIGSGPFKVVEYIQDQFIRYERFPDYHRGPAAADGHERGLLRGRPAGPGGDGGGRDRRRLHPARVAAAVRGQPRFRPPPLRLLHRDHPQLQLQAPLAPGPQGPPGHPLRDRQGPAWPRSSPRGATPAPTTSTPTAARSTATTTTALGQDEFSVEKANALLDEAGWVMGSDGVREKDGERFSLPMLTYSGFEEYKNDLEILQQMLAEVGIETKPEIIDYDALDARWNDPNDDPLTRPFAIEEYPHPFEQDPDVYDELHSASFPPNGRNYNYIKDDEIDRLIDEGRTGNRRREADRHLPPARRPPQRGHPGDPALPGHRRFGLQPPRSRASRTTRRAPAGSSAAAPTRCTRRSRRSRAVEQSRSRPKGRGVERGRSASRSSSTPRLPDSSTRSR